MKKVIINADDFGYSKDVNEAIMELYNDKCITSASIMTNISAPYEHAICEIYPQIPTIDLGFHFNIVEGKSLSGSRLLCDSNGYFNNGFISSLVKSNNKKFIKAVEDEFRIQIEKVLKYASISHVDSHRHIHAIPNIFQSIIKLSKEYNIKYVRTQKEIPYIVYSKIINKKFPANVLKSAVLNHLSKTNTYTYTNDYFIGILYTGYMDEKSIIEGLRKITSNENTTEIIIHPTIDTSKRNNYKEYLTIKNPKLKQEISDLGFKAIQYCQLN